MEVNDFDAVRISLASPEQILGWSYGEVTKPETINYRTLKPERDGLFCERIFGPTKDFECACGKYKRIRYKGIICDKCQVEIAKSKVRRERMGHIELASPVSHIWFARGIPSRIGLLLDLSTRNLERVIYFSHFIVVSVDEGAKEEALKRLDEEAREEFRFKKEEFDVKITQAEENDAEPGEINRMRSEFDDEKAQIEEKYISLINRVKDLAPLTLLTDSQHQDMTSICGEAFEAGMGAEAVLKILRSVDLDRLRNELIDEIHSTTSSQRRKKASKRLQLVEAFRRSKNKPEWMVLTVLPVLPPELRPMVQLDGGRFATSDLNDLYRRVINRNNRLRHLMDIGAPEIIIRNEKRMLQEAVDSLIDNGRRGRTVAVSGDHKAKSLSDILRGKQGRFRQNLLGKRVDYSGRSVIVVGPNLKLHQCGLPRRMALELFKPFVIHKLVLEGFASNIKSARRLVDKATPEVYDALEEVVQGHPVLLNRAPTLHRLSVQAFEPVLIDGSAIQIHPLVCAAFNADFDGDQMAVHVPLSKAAIREAKMAMLSIYNMLLPSCGEPVVTPTLDLVFGIYYLTSEKDGEEQDKLPYFNSFEGARMAYEMNAIGLRDKIKVRVDEDEILQTTVGRILFSAVLPKKYGFCNKLVDKSTLKQIISDCYKLVNDNVEMAAVLDGLKDLGFKFATQSGITISMGDIEAPPGKPAILAEAEERTALVDGQYQRGLITEDERYNGVIEAWMEATDKITQNLASSLSKTGSVYMMSTSGAKGNLSQIRQMAGLRGLMTNPSGRIIDFPIKSSLKEGLSTLEYFISTHGARKGLADTALRTSGSGYLTRRLVDVTQDVIVSEKDCGTLNGIWVIESKDKSDMLPPFGERIAGRIAAEDIYHPVTGALLVERNQEIDENLAEVIIKAGIDRAFIRSAMSCESSSGICQYCYGRDLASGKLVELSIAVGILAAQSIGEPGTQLTLRTFHTGGVVGLDITTGLPRVEELFEARNPKAQAVISEIDGTAEIVDDENGRRIRVTSTETYSDEYALPEGWQWIIQEGQDITSGTPLAAPAGEEADSTTLAATAPLARVNGIAALGGERLYITFEGSDEREYSVPAATHIRVKDGQEVKAGQQLTDGSINPQDILAVLGKEAVQRYIVDEVQKVYCSQGVHINDRHIEVIARQMLSKVRIDTPGDTRFTSRELVGRMAYEEENARVLAEGGEPATAYSVLMGITRSSLSTDSWLAAASFQETTRVLTEASIFGKIDRLVGLKENVIIGKLIPAHCQSCKDELENVKQAALEEQAVDAITTQPDAGYEACETIEVEANPVEEVVQVEESPDSEAGL
ncbi:MAG: DNA-directed RNA polymerase subunit beta' [Dehalococcoidales bacterium]|nr:DNA-directed RNA polymerase subunit beta' [Dehalococcoidales bacterium]MDD5121924.1 DNA-directed RNA polymerase subunit beta' [Dehalococcoidales bacterium]MDD5498320.1 DNA-directed RNA polymerase subunit beta' [Dehalococcoidales bacterium]MDX9803291.1 DNA-directed RNA polymerase subunit beta' [Dehalococcoidales bacterium]